LLEALESCLTVSFAKFWGIKDILYMYIYCDVTSTTTEKKKIKILYMNVFFMLKELQLFSAF